MLYDENGNWHRCVACGMEMGIRVRKGTRISDRKKTRWERIRNNYQYQNKYCCDVVCERMYRRHTGELGQWWKSVDIAGLLYQREPSITFIVDEDY